MITKETFEELKEEFIDWSLVSEILDWIEFEHQSLNIYFKNWKFKSYFTSMSSWDQEDLLWWIKVYIPDQERLSYDELIDSIYKWDQDFYKDYCDEEIWNKIDFNLIKKEIEEIKNDPDLEDYDSSDIKSKLSLPTEFYESIEKGLFKDYMWNDSYKEFEYIFDEIRNIDYDDFIEKVYD